MQELITSKRNELAALCKQHHVRRLAVFGSAARNDFDTLRSDIDLLVEFEPLAPIQYSDNYFNLLNALNCLFRRDIDLITWKSIRNPYFLREVESSNEILYAA
jgi:predicted nucleotidyltransferase